VVKSINRIQEDRKGTYSMTRNDFGSLHPGLFSHDHTIIM